MAEYNNIITLEGVTRTEIIGEELTKLEADKTAFANKSGERKLEVIKQLRLEKLMETDYLALSDNIMSDEMKAFRKSMRDIPQDYTADKYDELLATDDDGNLTHSVWSKP